MAQPPRTPNLLRRWEALEGGKQAAVAYPLLAIVLSALHWTVLSQPFGRGLGYGLFWAVPATAAVVVAAAGERARRRSREGGPPGPGADVP